MDEKATVLRNWAGFGPVILPPPEPQAAKNDSHPRAMGPTTRRAPCVPPDDPPPAVPMTAMSDASESASPALPVLLAADLQDHLLIAGNDLDRLQRLLHDTCDTLLARFAGALAGLAGAPDSAVLEGVRRQLGEAVTALQFQDLASQLIAHTHQRLRNCADQLAADAFASDGDGEAVVAPLPLRPNPVTQDEMDAGSVELF